MSVQPQFSSLGFAPSMYTPGQYNMAPQYINPYYQAAQQGVQQQQAQGGGPSLLNSASNIKSIVSPSTGGGFINNLGGSMGFATTSPTATYMGGAGALPWQSAGSFAPSSAGIVGVNPAGALQPGTSSIFGGSTLGGTLGAAGLGALAGNFLGKIGGNSTGGSIGGGLGAGIGMAVGGPPGAIIGGLIGGIGGGFFGGNKPATKSDTYGAMITANGMIDANTGGSTGKNPGEYKGFGQRNVDNFSKLAQDASKTLGIQFNNTQQVNSGISTLHGGAYFDYGLPNEGERKRFWFDHTDAASSQGAAVDMLKSLAQDSGYTDMAAIDKFVADKQAGGQSYMIPIKDKVKFDDFMSKFKTQGAVDGTNAAPTTP